MARWVFGILFTVFSTMLTLAFDIQPAKVVRTISVMDLRGKWSLV